MLYTLDLFGTAVFAVTGSLAAGRKRMDLFGVVVLGLVTALGGGTLRDVMLGAYPVFWVADPTYLLVVVAAAILTFLAARAFDLPGRLLLVADAFGLAVFTVIGVQKALGVAAHPAVAVMMGVMTGVAGGMVRDVLSGAIPLILRREIYATASLCGAIAYVGAVALFPGAAFCPFVGIGVILAVRLAAIRWRVALPVFASRNDGPDPDQDKQ